MQVIAPAREVAEAKLSTRRRACVIQNQIPGRHRVWQNQARAPRATEDRSLCACPVSTGRSTRLRQLPRTSPLRTTSRSLLLGQLAWTSRNIYHDPATSWNFRSARDLALDSEKPPECLAAKGGYSIKWSPNVRTPGANTLREEVLLVPHTLAQRPDAASGALTSACRSACLPIAGGLR